LGHDEPAKLRPDILQLTYKLPVSIISHSTPILHRCGKRCLEIHSAGANDTTPTANSAFPGLPISSLVVHIFSRHYGSPSIAVTKPEFFVDWEDVMCVL
jgi:hypothetical protein